MNTLRKRFYSNDLIDTDLTQIHHSDSFQKDFFCDKVITSNEIGKAFFISSPSWIDRLFNLRNKLMGFFGFKVSGSRESILESLKLFQCEPGDQIGIFRVIDKNEHEVILGEDDKHLNFRISLYLQTLGGNEKKLVITTYVQFNNFIGKLYFFLIQPLHRIIVPVMLKGIVHQLIKFRPNEV